MSEEGYIKGNFWFICDRCSEKRRIRQGRKTWDGLLVCYPECWERKHPQLSVEVRAEHMSVPIARPDVITRERTTTLSSDATKNARSIVVVSASHIADGDGIGIVLSSKVEDWDTEEDIQWTYVDGDPVGTTIPLGTGLWAAAASGNKVYLGHVRGDNFIESTATTVEDL